MTSQSSGLPAATTQRFFVLYDGESGTVEHIHVVREYPGGRSVPEEESSKTARRQAGLAGREAKQLKMLISEDSALLSGSFRVDTQTDRLVPLDPPESTLLRIRE